MPKKKATCKYKFIPVNFGAGYAIVSVTNENPIVHIHQIEYQCQRMRLYGHVLFDTKTYKNDPLTRFVSIFFNGQSFDTNRIAIRDNLEDNVLYAINNVYKKTN